MKLYAVTFDCARCGKVHEVTGGGACRGMVIDGGPDHAGTVAELWPAGNLPANVARLLGDLTWCDGAGEYVELSDPARVTLTPWPGPA